MYRKEEGSYGGQRSIDLQIIKDYEQTGCRLKEFLENCKKRDVKLEFRNKTIEPDQMMEIYQMIMERTREKLKAEQRAGIKQALKRQEEGEGTYGRPRVELPSDFEKQLKERIRNQENLSTYCEQFKMEKSAFYKWVKVYRDSWEEEKKLLQVINCTPKASSLSESLFLKRGGKMNVLKWMKSRANLQYLRLLDSIFIILLSNIESHR